MRVWTDEGEVILHIEAKPSEFRRAFECLTRWKELAKNMPDREAEEILQGIQEAMET